ncbi:MAG: hypothetical protein PUC73_12635 [Lachnospiraceae bacterium]|nr:hypothetical protein [Lachnospiraceae bacterium]
MSVDRRYYLINGYDLTGMDCDKLKDWKWTDEGEDYFCYQRKGKIQLFDDPMSGTYLYFGYILGAGDQYEFETVKIDSEEVVRSRGYVEAELIKLQELGVITKDPKFIPKLELIMFEECS